MAEHEKSGKRLGLAALAMASLAAPVVIPEEAAAAGANGTAVAPHGGGPQNTIVLGADGKAHNQTIVLGNDGKPQNNRFVIGRDGKYHDSAGDNAIILQGGTPAAKPNTPGNNHTGYRRSEEP